MPSELSPNRHRSEVEDKDRDQKHRRRHQDALRLENPRVSDAKAEVNDSSHVSNRKANEQGAETIKSSDPTAIPRSRSYFQHDDRGTASQDGRHSGRRVTGERGWWKDSKDEEERANSKTANSNLWEKERKPSARGSDRDNNHIWRHDKFSEMDNDSNPPAKKRRQFREEKLPTEPEPTENTTSEPNKATHTSSERREERSRDRRPLERREYDREYQRERSFSNWGLVEKPRLPPGDRFNGGDNGGRYRGRDRFGGRQGFRPSGPGGRIDKWKHDLYDEANKSPTPNNEEDPVAKVEALLAS